MARILLVDDDYNIRELGRALLTMSGHEVHTSDGAINALIILREYNNIDMLITDVNMPNHSGFDLLKMIRLEAKWPFLMTVMLTGRREKRDVEAAAREGVDAYIVKPIDPELFVKRIDSLLARDTEVALPSVDFSIVAQIAMKVEIRSVSELGIVIKSPYQFRSGTLLPLDSAIFRRIGIANPLTRVFVSQRKDGDWETRLSYVDLNEDDLAKVRAWTTHQQPVKKSRAA